MNEEERLFTVQRLREEGKVLYNSGDYDAAAEKYGKGIGIVENLMINEKPRDPEWWKLEETKRPLLINYALCKMQQKEYYDAIERTSEVLKNDADNVKALFIRARAYAKSWNVEEAKADFVKALKLDSSLTKSIHDELEKMEKLTKEKDKEEAKLLRGKLF